MSQQVTVDYQGISIQVQAQCDTAIHSLCRIDKTLNKIYETSSKLESSKVQEYEKQLLRSKEIIKNKIEKFKKTLDKYKEAKAYSINNHQPQYKAFLNFTEQVKQESEELMNTVNELTGSKLAIVEEMINQGLLDYGNVSVEKMMNKFNGGIDISNDKLDKLNEIEDVSLRELVYQEFIKDSSLSLNEALANANKKYYELLNKSSDKKINEYKDELSNKGIDTAILDNIKSIDEANKIVNEAISDETIRKETLKVIIKAIKSRGFIVDTKNNLKIDKKRNVVKLVALKASGQMAEFEIQLNGKFMYHFDEYEGHACKKDIEPFLEDLKNIYDINILHEEVTWQNPDKVQMKKYQYVKVNKGNN